MNFLILNDVDILLGDDSLRNKTVNIAGDMNINIGNPNAQYKYR